jgi:hypothetical protein
MSQLLRCWIFWFFLLLNIIFFLMVVLRKISIYPSLLACCQRGTPTSFRVSLIPATIDPISFRVSFIPAAVDSRCGTLAVGWHSTSARSLSYPFPMKGGCNTTLLLHNWQLTTDACATHMLYNDWHMTDDCDCSLANDLWCDADA